MLYFGFERNAIGRSLRKTAWHVVDQVADDPGPAPKDGQRPSMDTGTLSLSSTCPFAIHAVMQYALWVYRNAEGDIRPGGFGMGSIPEVRERLERDLDPAVEFPAAARAVFGRWFPWLVLLDRGWIETKIEAIFPDDRPVLRDAAWETYLESCRPDDDELFGLLWEQYSAAVDRLTQDAGGNQVQGSHGSPGKLLGEHLLIMVGRGKLSWADDDGLVRRFFENAPAEDAAEAVASMGVSLNDESNDIPGEVLERFRRLWEALSAFASSRKGDRMEILKAYDLWFASGRFSPEWALDQLDTVIEQAKGTHSDPMVIETLAELAADYPARSLSALRALARCDERGWNILGSEDNVRAILKTCLEQETTRLAAKTLVNELGARGHFQFRDILAN